MPLRVSVEAAPAYELVLSMAAPQALAPDPALQARLDALGHGSDLFWAHLLSVAVESPPPRDSAAFLAHLSSVDARDLRLRLAGYHVRWFRRLTPPAVIERALAGDAGARSELLATSDPEDPAWQAALRELLSTPAATLKRRVLDAVTRWDAAMSPALDRTHRLLRAEAQRARRQATGADPLAAVAAIAGHDYVPEPGVERVLLIPSAVIHPVRHVFDHQQLKLICYPVALPDTATLTDPSATAALFHALGDTARLRILRMLAREPLSAARIAQHLRLPMTTATHHLAVLRRAGVLRGGGARGLPYSLDPTLPDRARDELRRITAVDD